MTQDDGGPAFPQKEGRYDGGKGPLFTACECWHCKALDSLAAFDAAKEFAGIAKP